MGLTSSSEPLYMLDTNTVNALQNGDPVAVARLAQVKNVCVSSIVVEEILVKGHGTQINAIRGGASKASMERTNEQFVDAVAFLATFPLLAYSDAAESLFRTFKAAKLKGMDGRIAAHATSAGAIPVTRNERDFAGVSGLAIENWLA